MTPARSDAKSDGSRKGDVLVALTTLVAEGTPVLTLDLFRAWLREGIRPAIMTLYDEPNDLEPEFLALGTPVHRAVVPRAGMRRYGALIRETARICREVQPRAFLSMPFGWHAFMALGARWSGVPTIAAHVGSYPPVWQGRNFWKFGGEVWLGRPFTDVLICCSRYVEHGVREHLRGARGRTAVAYSGVRLGDVAARASAARGARTPGGSFRVGMVARLESSKDHNTLLEAVALARRDVELDLWLIGDGSRRRELEARSQALGLQGRTSFFGSRRDVPELLGQLDAFVFSVRPDEGLGIALIEAMTAEVPIIATDVGACREVLGGSQAGKLVPFGDAAAMAAVIVELARRGPAPGAVDSGSRRAAAAFSSETMAKEYARLLRVFPRQLASSSLVPATVPSPVGIDEANHR